MSTTRILFVSAIAAFTIAACGNKDAEQSQSQASLQPSGFNIAQGAGVGVSTPAAPTLPIAEAATPLSTYVNVDSGIQLAYLYYAVSGLPTDYEKLAEISSQDYRSTTDSFKKKDILDTLKPQIDQQPLLTRGLAKNSVG